MLSTDQSFEILPRHNGIATTSESLVLNLSAVSVCSNTCVGPLPKSKCFLSYYQHEQKNSYILQNLLRFDQIHQLEMKNLIFYQIQFRNPITGTYQYQHF